MSKESVKSYMRDMFKKMATPAARAEVMDMCEKQIRGHQSKDQGMDTVIKHIEGTADLNDATVRQNMLALLKTAKSHDTLLTNLSCIAMMTLCSDEWSSISRSARVTMGESQGDILKEMWQEKMNG